MVVVVTVAAGKVWWPSGPAAAAAKLAFLLCIQRGMEEEAKSARAIS